MLAGEVASGEMGRSYGWLRTIVDRTRGWHLFEVLFENDEIHFSIDGEPVGTMNGGDACQAEEVVLCSRCGGDGVWANIEVLHTPAGRHPWRARLEDLQPGDRLPWKVESEEGRWQSDAEGVMQNIGFHRGTVARVTKFREQLIASFSRCPDAYSYHPGMDEMLDGIYRVLDVNADGMVGLPSPDGSNNGIWWFPSVADAVVVVDEASVVPIEAREVLGASAAESTAEELTTTNAPELSESEPSREASSPEVSAREPMLIGGLAIECWSIAGEEDVVRMERVMATFVEAMEAAQIALPDNIRRIQQCAAPQHQSCFVYNFGTRRMHVATRVTDAGRLLLVVRCGGGFIDFVEFSRRHGSMEQLRLHKRPGSSGQGREVVRLTSVMSRGQVRAMATPSRTGPRSRGARTPSPAAAAARA